MTRSTSRGQTRVTEQRFRAKLERARLDSCLVNDRDRSNYYLTTVSQRG